MHVRLVTWAFVCGVLCRVAIFAQASWVRAQAFCAYFLVDQECPLVHGLALLQVCACRRRVFLVVTDIGIITVKALWSVYVVFVVRGLFFVTG